MTAEIARLRLGRPTRSKIIVGDATHRKAVIEKLMEDARYPDIPLVTLRSSEYEFKDHSISATSLYALANEQQRLPGVARSILVACWDLDGLTDNELGWVLDALFLTPRMWRKILVIAGATSVIYRRVGDLRPSSEMLFEFQEIAHA